MSRRFIANFLFRLGTSRSRTAGPQPRRPKHQPLRLEILEDRITPTVLFTPQFGAETTTNHGTELNDNPGTNVYMIYRGSYWNTSAGQTMATNIQNSVDNLLYFSPYLDGLHQYGVPYRAYAPAISVNHVFNYTDMPNGFTTTDIANTVQDAIYNKGLPEADTYTNRAIYFVVTAPGVTSSNPNAGAYHTSFTDNHNANDPDTVIDGWIGGPSLDNLDTRTYYLSHETAEAMSDPFGTGITTTHGASWTGGGDFEIADAEAQNYTYRLNGYLVNSYWSTANNAYMVSDGNTQTVTVNNRNLIVNGDQLANHNDNITLDVQNGGVRVTENGEVFQFDPGQISSITVNTGTGTDTVNVLRTVTPVNINYNGGSNTDVANLGTGGSMAGIQGAVTIYNGPSHTHVNIDDSADTLGRGVSIGSGGVSGLGSAAINFTDFSVDTLNVLGGSGNNTYTISGTPAASSMTLNTGGGVDTMNVQAVSAPLAITTTTGSGGGGNDVANLGNAGNMQSITSAVTIVNTLSHTHVNLNDAADSGNRNVAIGPGGVTGLAPTAINFKAGAVNTLTINGGGGTDTYTVTGTPASTGVTLTAGSGNNTLIGPNVATTWQITGTNAGQLTGTGLVPITFTGVANLIGNPNANDNTPNDFVFSDGAGVTGTIDGGGRNQSLGTGELDYGAYTTPVTVNLSTNTATGAGSVSDVLNVRGGAGDDNLTGNANVVTFFIASPGNDTVTGLGSPTSETWLESNGGNDTWNITGHNAGTLTFAGNTTTFTGVNVLEGGDVADDFVMADGASLDVGIVGGIGVNTLDESAYTTPVTVHFTNSSNLGFASATGLPGVESVQNFIGGSATNTLIGPNANMTWNVTAQNAGNLSGNLIDSPVNFSGFQNLTGGSGNDTFVLSDGAGVTGTIDGGGGTNTLDESAYSTPVTVDLTANTATGVGTIANLQNFIGAGAGGNTLNGPAANTVWTITGTDSGSLTGGISFSSFQNLSGGAGNNTFVIAGSGGVDGTITGGGGINSLDYSAFSNNVLVDLQTGFATSVGGGLLGTFTNVHGSNLSGSGLYNLLIGAGGNVLTGGTGRRNILVAGASASTLIGGTQEDLLIGGTTLYDNAGDNLASWLQLAGYWAGTDLFNTRVNNLLTGNGVPLLDPTIVTGNGGGNTMTGDGELAFIYSDGSDTINGFDPNSPIEPISP